MAGHGDRRGQDPLDAVGELQRARLVEPGGDHDELVAAEPGDQVTVAARPGQPAGDGAEQLVAGAVPERVVDDLEAVEVQEQQGQLPALHEQVLELLGERGPVGQPGERVGQRHPGQPLLSLDPGADVAGGGLGLVQRAVVTEHRAHHRLAPQPVPVAVPQPVAQRARAAVGADGLVLSDHVRPVLRVGQVHRVAAEHVLVGPAQHVGEGGRGVGADAVAAVPADHVGAVLGQQPEVRLGLDQGVPGALGAGDVAVAADRAVELAVRAQEWPGRHPHPAGLVGPDQAHQHPAGRPAPLGRLLHGPLRERPRRAVGPHHLEADLLEQVGGGRRRGVSQAGGQRAVDEAHAKLAVDDDDAVVEGVEHGQQVLGGRRCRRDGGVPGHGHART